MLDPGIVDDDVNMAEPLSGLARHRANRFRLRHVGAVVGNVDVVVFGERRPNCFNFGLVTEAVQHDGGAPLGKGAGNSKADATRRAGHDRRRSFKRAAAHHLFHLFLVHDKHCDLSIWRLRQPWANLAGSP